jgi:hypothetical protein
MAGVIQLGDAIKFAELAWIVWEYGWASEHNAGQFAAEFFPFPYRRKVKTIATLVPMSAHFTGA